MPEIVAWAELADLVRHHRRRKHLTQAQVARAIGVSDGYIAKIEAGTNRGSYAVLSKLSQTLEIPWLKVAQAGDLVVPSVANPSPEMTGLVDEMLLMYSPQLKEMLVELAKVIRSHCPQMG